MTNLDSELQLVLHDRSQAVVDGWYRATRDSLIAVHRPSELRRILSDTWNDVAAFLLLDEGRPGDAAPIGASLAHLRIRPGDIGRIQRVLLARLLEGAPCEVERVLQARVPILVAGLTTGFVEVDRERLLAQQEEIREAYGRALRQAEDRLRIVNAGIESSINAVAMLDLDGRMTYVNSAFLSMWGYEADDQVLGRHVSEFGEWQGDVERAFEILSQDGGWVGELVGTRHDGTSFDVLASASLVQDRVGRGTGLMAFFVDITERKKTQRALRRRATQAAFLNKIGEEIAGQRTPQAVLERAVELAHETFDLHQVAVLLIDREQEALEIAAVASKEKDLAREAYLIPLDKGITGWVARENRTLIVDDVSTDPRYIRLFPNPVTARSELAVPIRTGGSVIGVLDAQSPTADAFDDSERVVMETMADQIAVALENAHLYRALQDQLARRKGVERTLRRTVQRLETVHEIDRAILGARSIQEIASSVVQRLSELVPCQRVSIDVFDWESAQVTVLAAVQTIGEGQAGTGTTFPLTEQAWLLDLWERGREALVLDAGQLRHEASPLIRTVIEDGIRSFIVVPIGFQDELIGLLKLGSDQPNCFGAAYGPILKEMADTVAIAIQQARLMESVTRQQERLRQTMSRLAEVEETERRRVVRVLHDRVGQNLTALDLNLSLVRSQLEGHGLSRLRERLDDSLSLLAQTSRRTRQLMIELRPPVLDDYGLLSALHWYGDQFSARTGITVAVKGREGVDERLPPHAENALFRISQEALNNIAKHANAGKVTIALSADETMLQLTIKDDGRGFDLESAEGDRESWGLLTMRERAESVGARCCFESDPGDGTSVLVEMPI